MAKKRRLDKDLIDFFNTVDLEYKHKQFIEGCLKCQKQYPQLSLKQWRTVTYLVNVYIAKTLNSDSATVEDNVKVESEHTVKRTTRIGKKELTTRHQEMSKKYARK